jgi:thiazole synthase
MSTADSLTVKLNGESRRVTAGSTIAAMLGELGLNAERVAVERNFEIVPRSTLGEVEVRDGDAFEIVHFVGGG